jgi:hypothetical protein
MSTDTAPTIRRDKHNRSATTNGNRQFAQGGDGRGAWVRRWRDLTDLHVGDLGGRDTLSEGQLSLCRKASTLEVSLEQIEACMSEGKDTPEQLDLYNRLSGNLRRILETIGLKRVAKTVSPMERLEQHRKARREAVIEGTLSDSQN